MRKLEDSSWLAQIISDKMGVEFSKNGASIRWNCLQTLLIIVRQADDKENNNIYYKTENNNRGIIIRNIPSLTQYGSDFDKDGMRNKLRGLAERYTNWEGDYIVHILTTHDLNSAIITSIDDLLLEMAS